MGICELVHKMTLHGQICRFKTVNVRLYDSTILIKNIDVRDLSYIRKIVCCFVEEADGNGTMKFVEHLLQNVEFRLIRANLSYLSTHAGFHIFYKLFEMP